jgi:hypothetical protein
MEGGLSANSPSQSGFPEFAQRSSALSKYPGSSRGGVWQWCLNCDGRRPRIRFGVKTPGRSGVPNLV